MVGGLRAVLLLSLFLFVLEGVSFVSALPDLTPSQTTVTVIPQPTICFVNMSSRVFNQGNQSAPPSTAAWVLDAGSPFFMNVSTVLPGTTVFTDPMNFVVAVGGGFHLAVFYVDYLNAIVENSETNNNASRTFTCSPTNSTNQTHLECRNQACVVIAGGGSNQCTSNSQCQSQNATHLACLNNACTRVAGNGTNNCSPEGSACGGSHLECRNLACQNVTGPGTNTCTSNSNCSHLACSSDRRCILVAGGGSNIDRCKVINQSCRVLYTLPNSTGIRLSPDSERCIGLQGFLNRVFGRC